MPLYRFLKANAGCPNCFFSAAGNYVVVINWLCVCFVLTFFVIWTNGVRDKQSLVLNCNTEKTQKTTEGLDTPI